MQTSFMTGVKPYQKTMGKNLLCVFTLVNTDRKQRDNSVEIFGNNKVISEVKGKKSQGSAYGNMLFFYVTSPQLWKNHLVLLPSQTQRKTGIQITMSHVQSLTQISDACQPILTLMTQSLFSSTTSNHILYREPINSVRFDLF